LGKKSVYLPSDPVWADRTKFGRHPANIRFQLKGGEEG